MVSGTVSETGTATDCCLRGFVAGAVPVDYDYGCDLQQGGKVLVLS